MANRIEKRKKTHTLRTLPPPLGGVDLSSNDYLGLSENLSLKEEMRKNWEREGFLLGSTGSRLLTGNSLYAEKVEKTIASFHGYETASLFGSGYLANLALFSSLPDKEDAVFFDAHVHASIRDGLRLGKATAYPFRHNDLIHLEDRLKRSPKEKKKWIAIESLYSTDGTKAPLSRLAELASLYEAHLLVDEAHAVGVLGPQGRGLAAAEGLQNTITAQVVTFGKALGCQGASVLGSSPVQEILINYATPYVYTTAPAFFSLAAIEATYALFPTLDKERDHLFNLIAFWHTLFPNSSPSHIQGVSIPTPLLCKKIAHLLQQKGFKVHALVSPTVQQGKERIRVCLHSFNTKEEIQALYHTVEALCPYALS